jgi:hypothetical protein
MSDIEQTQTLAAPDHAARMDAMRARQTADEEKRRMERIERASEEAAVALTRLAVLSWERYFYLVSRAAIQAHANLPDSEKPAAEAAIMKEVTP